MTPEKNLTSAQLQSFSTKSDLWGFWTLFFNWFLILASLVIAGIYTHPVTIIGAVILIGGRQLGLGILMHDCSHFALFKTRSWNEFFGRWFCSIPIFLDLKGYRSYHLKHHRMAGTEQDPDRPNYISYPVSKKSFIRKITRDLLGITGVKNFIISVYMYAELLSYELSYKQQSKVKTIPLIKRWGIILRRIYPCLLFQLFLFLVLFVFGVGWTYSLWVLSYLTTYSLFSRIRNAAEHAAVPDIDSTNMYSNTRTTLASWWERLTIAPNFVNYHLEHHLMPQVAPHHLKRLHVTLSENEYFSEKACVANGYGEVLRKLIST